MRYCTRFVEATHHGHGEESMPSILLSSHYPTNRFGTFQVEQMEDGFYIYLSTTHQASMNINRATLEAIRDEINKVLKIK